VGMLAFGVSAAVYYSHSYPLFLYSHDDVDALQRLAALPQGLVMSSDNYSTMVMYLGKQTPYAGFSGGYGEVKRNPAVTAGNFKGFFQQGLLYCPDWAQAGVKYVFVGETDNQLAIPANGPLTVAYRQGNATIYYFNASAC
jgi:hypothetical protein